MLYDGGTLVASSPLRAANANGKLHLELLHQPEFTSVVFLAGAIDGAGLFQPGGLVDANGLYAQPSATVGSDYLIEALQFLNLPDVLPTGVITGFGG